MDDKPRKRERGDYLVAIPVAELTPELRALARRKFLIDSDNMTYILRKYMHRPKKAQAVFSMSGDIKHAIKSVEVHGNGCVQ